MHTRTGLLMAALTVGVALATGPAQAGPPDRLDGQLHQRMEKVVADLKAKYKNVGVLRFRVQEGDGPESFDAPLSGRMVEKVQTVLILHNGADEKPALGIAHDANATAASGKVAGWYTDAAERKKLFDLKYLRAWDEDGADAHVSLDAFVTGKVTVSKDRKQTTVALEAFDRADPMKLQSLGSFALDTDRFILRDLGYSFVATRGHKLRQPGAKATTADEDKYIIEDVNERHPVKAETASPPARLGDVSPDSVGGVKLELLVNDRPATIRESATAGDAIKWQVECPRPGAKVQMRLTNTAGRKLGAVLRVNGVSTNREQREEPENAKLWILPAGAAARLPGFITDLSVKPPLYKPFRIVVGDEEKRLAAEVGEKKGLIEVDVFEEGPVDREPDGLISSKGLPPSKEKQARSSYLTLRTALLTSNKLKTTTEVVKADGLVSKKGMLAPDKDAIDLDMKVRFEDFPRPRLVARLTVKVIPADNPPRD